ncbi:MAG: preprotein translocase subunit SecG [Polyangia bacterium]
MVTLITIIHVFVCFFLILVVLLQAGKGGGMGIAFGSSTSSQVFGGRGAGSFLEKLTAGTAIIFMCTSITLAYFASQSDSSRLQKLSAQKAAQQQKDAQKAADEKVQKEAAERAKALTSQPAPSTPAPAATPATTPAPTAPKAAPSEPAKSDSPSK